jgi:hypothetical protein
LNGKKQEKNDPKINYFRQLINFTFYEIIKFDELVKSLERRISVIPANPGSRPGQAPESSYFKYLKILWTPVSTGVTTFYDSTIFEDLVIF